MHTHTHTFKRKNSKREEAKATRVTSRERRNLIGQSVRKGPPLPAGRPMASHSVARSGDGALRCQFSLNFCLHQSLDLGVFHTHETYSKIVVVFTLFGEELLVEHCGARHVRLIPHTHSVGTNMAAELRG